MLLSCLICFCHWPTPSVLSIAARVSQAVRLKNNKKKTCKLAHASPAEPLPAVPQPPLSTGHSAHNSQEALLKLSCCPALISYHPPATPQAPPATLASLVFPTPGPLHLLFCQECSDFTSLPWPAHPQHGVRTVEGCRGAGEMC